MTESIPYLELKGLVNISLDEHPVKMECEGQCIKLTFTSYAGVRKFNRCKQTIDKIFNSSFTELFIQNYKLSYYIDSLLIGESNRNISSGLLEKFLGLKNTRIYLKSLFKHLRF